MAHVFLALQSATLLYKFYTHAYMRLTQRECAGVTVEA